MKEGDKFKINWPLVLDSGRRIKGLPAAELDSLRDRYEDEVLEALSVGETRVWFHYPDQRKGWVYTASLKLIRPASSARKKRHGASTK